MAFEFLMTNGGYYLALAALFGIFMAWGIGANDVANAMATSVGSKALTVRQAIMVAAVFEFAGAVLAGGAVTSTIRKGIVDSSFLVGQPEILVLGMLAALLAAGCWLLLASRNGWPVSTTHSIVGAIVGFAVVGMGVEAVKWDKVLTIVASWVASPLTAGIVAFLIYNSVQWLILSREDPLERARRYVPFYMFAAAFVMTLVTLFKGLQHVGIHVTNFEAYMLATAFGVLIATDRQVFHQPYPGGQEGRQEIPLPYGGEGLWHIDGRDCLRHGLCAWLQRRGQRSRSGCGSDFSGSDQCSGSERQCAHLGAVDGRHWHCDRTGDLWPACHRYGGVENYPPDTQSWFRR